MEIRFATVEDAGPIVALINRLIQELGGAALAGDSAFDACRDLLSDRETGFALIAEEDESAIGVCTLSFQRSVRTLGKYAIVQEMYVIPERRSDEVGKTIIERAIKEARSHGCGIVELGTPPDGERQVKFYERLGFKPVGLRLRWTDH